MRETVEIMRYPVTLTPAPEGGYMVSKQKHHCAGNGV